MARVQIWEVVQELDGDAVSGASVQVNIANTATPVFVYTAETGGGGSSGPVTTVNGAIPGWVEEGSYDLVCANPVFTRRFNAVVGGAPGLGANSVTSTHIANDAVGTSEIAADSVGSSEIAPGGVTGTEIASSTITSGNIIDAAVTDADLAAPNNSVWKTLEVIHTRLSAGHVAGNSYFPLINGTVVVAGASFSSSSIIQIPITATELAVANKTTEMRWKSIHSVNNVAPATTINVWFIDFTMAGAVGNLLPTSTGGVLTPTIAVDGLAANSPGTIKNGTAGALPADNTYLIAMIPTNTLAANSEVNLTLYLQYRNV